MMIFMSEIHTKSTDSPDENPPFSVQDIEKLAQLSRLALTPEEKVQFSQDIGGILKYIGQIQEVAGDTSVLEARLHTDHYLHKNQMREDISYTGTENDLNPDKKDLVDSAPQHMDGYIKVKKIL